MKSGNNYNNEEDKDNVNADDGTVALVSSGAYVERFIFLKHVTYSGE